MQNDMGLDKSGGGQSEMMTTSWREGLTEARYATHGSPMLRDRR